MSTSLGTRIMIIGNSGAGKSTLARRLGELLNLPVIHLDAHFWNPGWVETPREEFAHTVTEMATGDRWVIDGNYSFTFDVRLAVADTIILLDYPWWLCLCRAVYRRWQYHNRTRPDMGPGCREQMDWAFARWICRDYPRNSRPKALRLLDEHRDRIQVIIHRSPGETRRWLEALTQ